MVNPLLQPPPPGPIKLADVPDYLDSEKAMIRTVWGALQRRFAHANMADNDTQLRFIREAKGVYAENGFVAEVQVTWQDVFDPADPDKEIMSPTVSDDPHDHNVYYLPRVQITGRVDAVKEFDHDRQRHDVQSGVLDGKPGVLDPNTGELKDTPKKLTIY